LSARAKARVKKVCTSSSTSSSHNIHWTWEVTRFNNFSHQSIRIL
jgi:hypothetical protein